MFKKQKLKRKMHKLHRANQMINDFAKKTT